MVISATSYIRGSFVVLHLCALHAFVILMNYTYFLLLCILAVSSAQIVVYQKCTNGTVWTPLPGMHTCVATTQNLTISGTSWYWDLSEQISTATVDNNPAQVYDFDLFYVSEGVINYIHQLNRTIICCITNKVSE